MSERSQDNNEPCDTNGQSTEALEPEPSDIEAKLEARATRERESPPLETAVSGLIAGLDVGFSPLGLAFVATRLAPLIGLQAAFLAGAAIYPIGFIFVILGRSQLFTESTLTPALGVMSGAGSIGSLLRQWGLVLGGNLVGAVLFATLFVSTGPIAAHYSPTLIAASLVLLSFDFVPALLSGILAGWVMAILSWLLAAADSTISKIAFVWLATFLIATAPLHHSVSGASEVLMAVMLGAASVQDWFVHFQLPATLGNAIGGVVCVAALKYLQAKIGGAQNTLLHR